MSFEQQTPKKMVVFDMDDTILQGRFIDVCAERFNFKQALSLLRQIDTDPVSLTVRIAAFLKDKRCDELLEIAQSIPMVTDIREVIAELKRRSYIIGIISDSYLLVTQFIGAQLNADFTMANELQCEEDVATGQVLIPSYFHYSEDSTCKHQVCKTNALKHISRRYDVALKNCIVVGDSESDVCMIRHAGLGVAFCTANETLKTVATRHIVEKEFKPLLDYTVH